MTMSCYSLKKTCVVERISEQAKGLMAMMIHMCGLILMSDLANKRCKRWRRAFTSKKKNVKIYLRHRQGVGRSGWAPSQKSMGISDFDSS